VRSRSWLIHRRDRVRVSLPCPAEIPTALKQKLVELRQVAGTTSCRNYLFASGDSDGKRAAAIYSLIGASKLNGGAPEAWLRHVLTHIAAHPVKRFDEFLPWHCNLPAALVT
jgi:hypothetical protein